MEDIRNTLFFIGDSVNVDIAKRLPHYVFVKNQTAKDDWKYMSWLRLYKYFRCWSYAFADLYIQDHLYIASQFIGPFKYTNLPDGPDCYTIWEKSPYQPQKYSPENMKQRIKHVLSHGCMYDLKYGCNEQCVNRWVMTMVDLNTSFIKEKKYDYIDAVELWKNASSEKKEFIKRVFGLSDEFVKNNENVETVILTQPFMEDCHLTEDEMYTIYSPYIVDQRNVAIKPHPRDKFDWLKYFPSASIIDTVAPMQLLNYIGLNPKMAVTVSSSSMSAMPESTKKIYLGTKVNNKIFQTYGDLFNAQ